MRAHETVAAASAVSGHGWHFAAAAVFLIAGLGAAAIADARDSRGDSPKRSRDVLGKPWLAVCALATVAAATVHVYVVPEHFKESALYGTFFVALAAAQLAWAALVTVRPTRVLLVGGVAGNVAVVLLWLLTRLVAVPLGPGAGQREAFGRLDVFATSCELLVIVAAVLLLSGVQTLKRNSVTSPSAIT